MLQDDELPEKDLSPSPCDSRYAAFVDVPMPDEFRNAAGVPPKDSSRNMFTALADVPKQYVRLEEKNVYCGAYNVRMVYDRSEAKRATHYAGKRFLAVGSYDNKIRVIDVIRGYVVRVIAGHAGSVRCVYLREDRQYVVTGSYDTTIRCWSTIDGSCIKIYRGHTGSVLCLDMYGKYCVSGSRDNEVKVWDFHTGKCYRTFHHASTVRAVQILGTYVVSGDDTGKVRLWALENSTCLKVMEGHKDKINSLQIDQWHIVSGSSDCTARLWITQGKYRWSIATYPHPSEVLSVQVVSLRIATACTDGKIRLWNMLTGECLRTLQGNSRSQSVRSIHASKNRLTVDTQDGVYLFSFAPINWAYRTPNIQSTTTRLITPSITDTNQEPQKSPWTSSIQTDQQKGAKVGSKIRQRCKSSFLFNKEEVWKKSRDQRQMTKSVTERNQTISCSSIIRCKKLSTQFQEACGTIRPRTRTTAWVSSKKFSTPSVDNDAVEKHSAIQSKATHSVRSETLSSEDNEVFTVTINPSTHPFTPYGRTSISRDKLGSWTNVVKLPNEGEKLGTWRKSISNQPSLIDTTPPVFPLKPDSLNLQTHTAMQKQILAFKARERENIQSGKILPLQHAHSWVGPTSSTSSLLPLQTPRSPRASSCGPTVNRSSCSGL